MTAAETLVVPIENKVATQAAASNNLENARDILISPVGGCWTESCQLQRLLPPFRPTMVLSLQCWQFFGSFSSSVPRSAPSQLVVDWSAGASEQSLFGGCKKLQCVILVAAI